MTKTGHDRLDNLVDLSSHVTHAMNPIDRAFYDAEEWAQPPARHTFKCMVLRRARRHGGSRRAVLMGRAMTDRPHLWVPYGQEYGCGDAEICTLCGEFSTPATRVAECAETLADELAPAPADLARIAERVDLDPADGADDEMRQGVVKPQP